MRSDLGVCYDGDATANPVERITQRLTQIDRLLERLVYVDSTWEKVIALIGDSGMGKTRAATAFISLLERDGVVTQYVSLGGLKSEGVVKQLQSLAREMVRNRSPEQRRVLVLDDMPATDECDLDRQLRSIRRLSSAGALIILCMRPECVQLVEEIDDVKRIQPEDMVIACSDIQAGRLLSTTNGIPALVAAYIHEPLSSSWEGDDARVARLALPIVTAYLRESLPIEEQRLRLAMLLLGEGDTEDLALVMDRCPLDTLSLLAHDAPLLGIDLAANRFHAACLASLPGLRVCVPCMKVAASSHPDVALQCALLLAKREKYARSAVVASLLGSSGAAELVREWGIEYLCAGSEAFVGRVLASEAWSQYRDDDVASDVERAYSLLMGAAKPTEPFAMSPAELASASAQTRLRWRHLELLQATRDLDCGIATPRVAHERDEDDQLASELALHVRTRTLLLNGNVGDAYQLLVNSPFKSGSETLAQLLLSDDYLIAQLLSGEELDAREMVHVMEVRARFAENPEARLARYRPYLEPILLVLAGRLSHIEGVEALISYADKMGDSALAAVFLLVAAIADNRVRAYTRAHVRSLQASARVSGAFGGLVGRQARLIAGLAAYMLEDEGGLVTLATEPPESLERDLAAYFCGERKLGRRPRPSVLLVSASSDNATWSLNMLCNDFGDLSDEFRGAIPPAWSAASRRMVRKAESFSRAMERELWRQDPTRQLGRTLRPVSGERSARIELCLLGELVIKVDGREVSAQRLDRRRAKSLLLLLASRKEHRASRYEIIESIWSEYDFEGGQQKVYEAIYAIRTAIGLSRKALDIFSNARGKATIGLNCEAIFFDVDAFERKARAALAQEGSAERVIALACDAMQLYRGDLCADPYDALNMVEARRNELRDLFVDLSITGARAAMKEGRMSLASRVASRGYEASPTREDVVLAYVEALKATGRYHDAREVYQHYSYAVVEATGMPPTRALRDAARDLMPAFQSRKAKRKAVDPTVE